MALGCDWNDRRHLRRRWGDFAMRLACGPIETESALCGLILDGYRFRRRSRIRFRCVDLTVEVVHTLSMP